MMIPLAAAALFLNPVTPVQRPLPISYAANAPMVQRAPGREIVYLRTGAFTQIENASHWQQDLARQGFQTQLSRVDNAGVIEVLVGPMQSLSQIDAVKSRLAAIGVGDSYVVRRIVP